jgi:maltooligosyltrehalose trehalohydrolase
VIYELHVGTFSEEGTFDGAIPYLEELRELGVTAIELMPVATFPGNRGWGYDGLYAYAPHPAYGGPEGLARLVDAAHAAGLGVILDVVYNHVGPGSEALAAFGPYFTDRHETFWGESIDYERPAVREWAIQNACQWVRDYHVDGLRLDAVQAILDDSPRHVLAELAERVHEESPHALVISETEVDDYRPIEEWGHDAQWADGFHHELHVLLTGERDGYYERFGSLEGLAHELERRPSERLVVYAQNHDQVGNRARGDRLPRELLRVAAACTLFAPHTPLLFMGEEYGEERPFQFFTDHIDPSIAEATREGRKREFERFSAFAGEVPDPQARETFERSKLDRSRADEEVRRFYRELLALRRDLPREVEVEIDEPARTLRARRGEVELVADFAKATVELRR